MFILTALITTIEYSRTTQIKQNTTQIKNIKYNIKYKNYNDSFYRSFSDLRMETTQTLELEINFIIIIILFIEV